MRYWKDRNLKFVEIGQGWNLHTPSSQNWTFRGPQPNWKKLRKLGTFPVFLVIKEDQFRIDRDCMVKSALRPDYWDKVSATGDFWPKFRSTEAQLCWKEFLFPRDACDHRRELQWERDLGLYNSTTVAGHSLFPEATSAVMNDLINEEGNFIVCRWLRPV